MGGRNTSATFTSSGDLIRQASCSGHCMGVRRSQDALFTQLHIGSIETLNGS